MSFRGEVRASLREIRDFMRVIAEREKEIERLSAQNKDLMDRLMSRNFETLMTYQPKIDNTSAGIAIPVDMDEQNAGELLDIEA